MLMVFIDFFNRLTFSTLLIIVIFSSVMPLGILIGELITEFQPIEDEPRKKHNDGNVLVGVLQALSSGWGFIIMKIIINFSFNL